MVRHIATAAEAAVRSRREVVAMPRILAASYSHRIGCHRRRRCPLRHLRSRILASVSSTATAAAGCSLTYLSIDAEAQAACSVPVEARSAAVEAPTQLVQAAVEAEYLQGVEAGQFDGNEKELEEQRTLARTS